MEGLPSSHLTKRQEVPGKMLGSVSAPFSSYQRSKAQRESHLSYGWLQMDNDIETLSLSLSITLLSSAVAPFSGRPLFKVTEWTPNKVLSLGNDGRASPMASIFLQQFHLEALVLGLP